MDKCLYDFRPNTYSLFIYFNFKNKISKWVKKYYNLSLNQFLHRPLPSKSSMGREMRKTSLVPSLESYHTLIEI